ncbi:cell wall metabolism sensor histidine kinase WalK [Demequina sp. NBRC 110057]|uniref:sensor histidine kinase n=1 Tax=Demequina sp. NBRC 110057 TaxID=1570346 RepID=UPI0013563D18|nr:HAMP domain-containing sensor histidine kinase [Demequina sp. NBRC 110057]
MSGKAQEDIIARIIDRAAAAMQRTSVRSRLLMYLIALTAAALLIAGLTAWAIERGRIDSQINDDLALRAQAFTELANDVDPTTGEPFASSQALMREAMLRVVASPTTSAVAHVGTVARYVPSTPTRLRLEDDEEFLQEAADHASETVVVRSVTTETADYRYAAVPIVEPDGTTVGVFTLGTDRGAQQANLAETFQLYALVALLALAMIGVVAWSTVGRTLQPIATLEARTRRISEHDLSQRIPVEGHDDLARLTKTVNAMLDRLERAFEDQRRLLDDASHELRTPLAIMRTNLEVLEPRDPEEVERSQGELLDEVSMMSRLVDDLVTLAKSDRPEFVHRTDTDLGELTDSTYARASALAERDWHLDGVGQGTVLVDAQRITQAWLQLAANAVKFSEPGSRILLGSSVSATQIRLWVSDEGIGIAPSKHKDIVERFTRLDPDVEGSGLGLTIVVAIVRAHGGRLDVFSEPGRGSTFTMILPRNGAQP